MKFTVTAVVCGNVHGMEDCKNLKCLKNVEKIYAVINEFIFVVKPWMVLTQNSAAVWFSFSATTNTSTRGTSIKLLQCYHLSA